MAPKWFAGSKRRNDDKQGDGKEAWWQPTAVDDAGAEGESEELAPGTCVGPYVIEEMCAEGGFAVVYRATDQASGEIVALKVLHRYLAASPKVLLRFQREVESVRIINHPNIVLVRDVGEVSPGRPYYAMEWLQGRTLDEELVLRGSFSLGEVLEVMEGLCPALAAAHAAGIVHRDLKASNVMLIPSSEGFVVKLVDFGIVKLLDTAEGYSESGLTTIGASLGTPHYMAPEQIIASAVDARTDIYAMGVLIFQLMTGRLPFVAATAPELGELHLRAAPPRASALAPVPTSVDTIVRRCLEKNPDRRYQSIDELLAALREARATDGDGGGTRRGLQQEAESWLSGDSSDAVGLYVELQIECPDDDIDDDLLDLLDEMLERCRAEFAEVGLVTAVDTGTALLGARPLPSEPADALTARRQTVGCALALQGVLGDALQDEARLTALLSVHAAPAETMDLEDDVQFVGGDLLSVGDWASDHPGGAVIATDHALADLDEEFEVEPADKEGRVRVLSARA